MCAGKGCGTDNSDGRWEALKESILWRIGNDGHLVSCDTTVFSKLLASLCENPRCSHNCGKKCKENVFVSSPYALSPPWCFPLVLPLVLPPGASPNPLLALVTMHCLSHWRWSCVLLSLCVCCCLLLLLSTGLAMLLTCTSTNEFPATHVHPLVTRQVFVCSCCCCLLCMLNKHSSLSVTGARSPTEGSSVHTERSSC